MGISAIYNTLADVVINMLFSAVFSLMYLWRMFRYSKKLSIVSLIMLAVCMALIVWIGIVQTKYESEKMEVDSKAQSCMYQFLSGQKFTGGGGELLLLELALVFPLKRKG